MSRFLSILRYWLPLAVVITLFCGIVYGTVQQVYRQSANDPQIQIAEDAANAINSGQPVASLIPQKKVAVDQSLSPFLIMYDENGQVIGSNGRLAGTVPSLPSGVFASVKQSGEDRFTWQPEVGVRIAAVVVADQNGFVLAGRSLREVEYREDNLVMMLEIGWVGSLIASFIAVLIFNYVFPLKETGKKKR